MPVRTRATPAVYDCLLAVGVPAATLCMRVPSSSCAFSAGQKQDPGSGSNYVASRDEQEYTVPAWRHSLLALHRLCSRRRMTKHWSSWGAGLVADEAATVPYSLGGLPVAAGEQDLSSFGQNLLHLLHPPVGAVQFCQVISLPESNAQDVECPRSLYLLTH